MVALSLAEVVNGEFGVQLLLPAGQHEYEEVPGLETFDHIADAVDEVAAEYSITSARLVLQRLLNCIALLY